MNDPIIEIDSPEHRRARAVGVMVVRAVATLAVWSVAVYIGMRLRHPLIRITLGTIALGISALIWTHNMKNRRNT